MSGDQTMTSKYRPGIDFMSSKEIEKRSILDPITISGASAFGLMMAMLMTLKYDYQRLNMTISNNIPMERRPTSTRSEMLREDFLPDFGFDSQYTRQNNWRLTAVRQWCA